MTDIKSISQLVAPIAQKYGADRVALFGSRAKNTATEMSDYDFIISKGKIQSLFQLASFIDEFEEVFERKVDVITDTSNDIVFLEEIKMMKSSSMNQRDKTMLNKVSDYCLEIKETHDYFKQDKELLRMKNMIFIQKYRRKWSSIHNKAQAFQPAPNISSVSNLPSFVI